MEELAPLELAMEWDNVGLQIGDATKKVSSVLVTLTVTREIVRKAIASEVDLIITHHPVIFKPLRQIRTDSPEGTLLAALLKHDLAVYVAHTNLDQAALGLNHWLAKEIGLEDARVLIPALDRDHGLGRIGRIAPRSLGEFATQLEALWDSSVKIVGDGNQTISKVAVVGGSGGNFVHQAKSAGADVLVTGDVSYHDAIDARNLGLAVLDPGHFATEKVVAQGVGKYLQDRFDGDMQILQDTSIDPFSF